MPAPLDPNSEEYRLAEQAATWFIRLREGQLSTLERQAFQTWLAADVRHQREFAHVQGLWGALDQIKPNRHKSRLRATALLLALSVTLGLTWHHNASHVELATAVGERKHLTLADGSELSMDGHTRVRVDQNLFTRRIDLEEGQIFIRVAQGWRPLVVATPQGDIRDIGTAFNVEQLAGHAEVTVQDGVVDIRGLKHAQSYRIRAGQRAYFNTDGVQRLDAISPENSDAWVTGRWVFDNMGLEQVVTQLNRQHERPVYLADSALGRYRVSGAFNAQDRAGLLQALTRLYPLRISERPEATYLNAR